MNTRLTALLAKPLGARPFTSALSAKSNMAAPFKDWNAAQYLLFEDERTRPCQDLVSRLPLQSISQSGPWRVPRRIVDLGCGPGNSTAVLASRFPSSHLEGLDSSPAMIERAKETLPDVQFTLADLSSYTPSGEPVDLFFSNATLQWLGSAERMNVIIKLIQSQQSGGVFAFQVPDNLAEPSHEAMRQTASDGPWVPILRSLHAGRESFQSPQQIYDQIQPLCSKVDLWRSTYYHVLENHQAIVEWLKGTGLKPFIDPLSRDDKQGFIQAYLGRLKDAYPVCRDGKAILPFPRFFMVAVKA